VPDINGLTVHLLEAGFEGKERPCVLLLHGFPELAYSWRKVMLPLAEAGFHVVAPDQRGYGRTTGWDGTSADQLISLAGAYSILGARLSAAENAAWAGAITKCADWIVANFPKGNIAFSPHRTLV